MHPSVKENIERKRRERRGPLQKRKTLKGDLTNFLSFIFKVNQPDTFQPSEPAPGILLVQGVPLDVCHYPVVRQDAPQCLANPRSKETDLFHLESLQ